MDEYNKLVEEYGKRKGIWNNDELPEINDEHFVCLVNDKFMYSDDNVYTYDEIIAILDRRDDENMEFWNQFDYERLYD